MEVGWSFGDIGYERLRLDFVHVWPSQDHEQLSRPGVSSSRRLRAAGRQVRVVSGILSNPVTDAIDSFDKAAVLR